MQDLLNRLTNYTNSTMSDPAAGTAPIKSAAMENINRGYSGAADRITSRLASRGMGSSGRLGRGMVDLETSRLGGLSNLQGQMAEYVLQRQDNAASLGSRLLASQTGQTTTGSGNMLSNGLMSAGNGLENLATLSMLSKILKGGSSPVSI